MNGGGRKSTYLTRIETDWDDLNTQQRKTVAMVSEALHSGDVTNRQVRSALRRGYKNKNKIKKTRPPSQWQKFVRSHYADYKENDPDYDYKTAMKDASRMWKRMSPAKKKAVRLIE